MTTPPSESRPGTLLARAWERLRLALEILAEESRPMPAGELWSAVLEVMPETPDEQQQGAPHQSRGRMFWQLQSVNLTKAGWLDKAGRQWRITDAGRAALREYPDATSFGARAGRLYREWASARVEAGRRAWLVRPRQGGAELVAGWKAEGFVSLAATHLGELASGVDQPAVRTAVEAGYQHLDYAQRVALANEYHAFLSRMEVDDVVLTLVDDRVSVGIVTGDPEFDAAAKGAKLRRGVDWLDAAPVAVDALSAPLPGELAQQGTVVDLTAAMEAIAPLLRTEGPTFRLDGERPPPTVADVVPRLRDATAELARDLHLDQDWLQSLVDLLQIRSQVVLFGPPGTGKTYVAQAVAKHVAGREGVRLVQFHPSYAYEDFFEGFRPVEAADGSSVGFAKTPGPLRKLAAEAKDNPGQPYVLIVDEINRANLAKVFGELYFLLEYRNESVLLQYSPTESFALPRNIFVIGTMNTADRSIALVDAAIRRRFAFVELHPDEEPVRSLLTNWLRDSGKTADGRAELLQALNEAIGAEDRDFKVGPSYLMRPDAEAPGGLERIWLYDLLPLLEEHYYGRLTRAQVHARFGLAAVRRAITADAAEAPASLTT